MKKLTIDLNLKKNFTSFNFLSKLPFYLLFLLLPLSFTTFFSDPFNFTKIILSAVLITVMFSALILRPNLKFHDTKIGPFVAAFLLVVLITGFMGKSLTTSFFGIFPSFSPGILAFLIFMSSFFLITNFGFTREDKEDLISYGMMGVGISLVLIILQSFGLPIFGPIGINFVNPLGSSETLRIVWASFLPFLVYFFKSPNILKRNTAIFFTIVSLLLIINPLSAQLLRTDITQMSIGPTFKTIADTFKTNALTGIGIGNLPYFFEQIKPAEFAEVEIGSTFSQLTDSFINFGIIGGAIFVIFLAVVVYFGSQRIKKNTGLFDRVLFISVVMLVVYQLLAPFNFVINLYFWVFLALFFGLSAQTSILDSKFKFPVYKGLIIASVGFFVLFLIGRVALAEQAFVKGSRLIGEQKIAEAQADLQQATALNPYLDIYQREYGRSLIASIKPEDATSSAEQTKQKVQEIVSKATKAGEKAVELNKLNKQNYIALTQIYFTSAFTDQSILPKVIETARMATQIAPNDPNVWGNLALIFSQVGQTGPAEQTYKEIVTRFPKDLRSYIALSRFYEQQKKYKESSDTLKQIKNLPQDQQPQVQAKIAQLDQLASLPQSTEAAQPQSNPPE